MADVILNGENLEVFLRSGGRPAREALILLFSMGLEISAKETK